MNRRVTLKALLATGLLAALPSAFALTANKDFAYITPPQPGGTNGQIEVIEFFSYGCPHCDEFDPLLAKWRATLPKDVSFRRVPVSFGRPEWATLGRIYLTLNAMGLSDKLDSKVFDAVHRGHISLWDEKPRNEWLTKQGVDLRKFNDTWRSFGIETMAKRSEQMIDEYKIQGVPTLAIDGRFFAGGAGFPDMLKNADALIAQVRADKAKKK